MEAGAKLFADGHIFPQMVNEPFLGVETHLESVLYAWMKVLRNVNIISEESLAEKYNQDNREISASTCGWGLSTECSNSASPWPVTLVLILPNSPQFFRTQQPLFQCACTQGEEKEKAGKKRERMNSRMTLRTIPWNWQIRPFKYKEKLEC